jgi:hypothetical protein
MSSKKKSRGKGGQQGDLLGGNEAGTEGAGNAGATQSTEPRKKLSVPERMMAKASNIHELTKDLLRLAQDRGAPDSAVSAMSSMVVEADTLCGQVRDLIASGWAPSEKKEMKDLATDNPIRIVEEHASMYSYIPEGTKLRAGQIVRSENGRIKSVQLRADLGEGEGAIEGEPRIYGWAQLSHITRR